MPVSVLLAGGLGNQLFIYNAAHYIENRFHTKICLISIIDKQTMASRPVELIHLLKNCDHNIEFKRVRLHGLLFRAIDHPIFVKARNSKFLNRLMKRFNLIIFDEDYQETKINQLQVEPKICRGYFQNFNLVENTFKIWEQEFTVRLDELGERMNLARKVQDYDVFIHVRRGDVLLHKDKIGVLSANFFQSEIENSSRILIASEDLEARSFFSSAIISEILNPLIFGPWEIIALARHCKKFIGSNSTLSWWSVLSRINNVESKSLLPFPWTKVKDNFELRIISAQVEYIPATYL